MAEKVVVNLDNLTFGDLEVLDRWQTGGGSIKDMLDILDKAVEGGVRNLPLTAMKDITQAIQAAVGGTDQKN